MADSDYNGRELDALGFRNIRVAGLLLDPSLLVGADPTRPCSTRRWHATGRHCFTSGSSIPHKRADFLIASFRRLLATHPDTTLVLAGNARLPEYRRAPIHDFIDDLGRDRSGDRHRVDLAESLSAHYRSADVMVTASEHEGFCVPLVEAMAFGVPIVARACAAIPETAGGCAVLVPPRDSSPTQFAAAVASVLDDLPAADAMRRCGHRRAEYFSLDNSPVTPPRRASRLSADRSARRSAAAIKISVSASAAFANDDWSA